MQDRPCLEELYLKRCKNSYNCEAPYGCGYLRSTSLVDKWVSYYVMIQCSKSNVPESRRKITWGMRFRVQHRRHTPFCDVFSKLCENCLVNRKVFSERIFMLEIVRRNCFVKIYCFHNGCAIYPFECVLWVGWLTLFWILPGFSAEVVMSSMWKCY